MVSQGLEKQRSGSAADRIFVAIPLTLFAIISFIPSPEGFASIRSHGLLLLAMLVPLGLAFALRAWSAAHVALICALYLGVYCIPVVGARRPLPLPIIFASYITLVLSSQRLRHSTRGWVRGQIDRGSIAWTLLFAICAAVALLTWRYFSGVDMTSYRRFVPEVPAWAVFAGLVPLAMLNAAFEEAIWRGVLWEGCERVYGRDTALIVTSLSFGTAHFRGFPSGALGVVLATIYGLMMGVLRIRTRGLLWPWAAHVLADVVIFSMVAAMVLFTS